MLSIRTDFQHSDPSLPISPSWLTLGLQMLCVLPHIQNLLQILKTTEDVFVSLVVHTVSTCTTLVLHGWRYFFVQWEFQCATVWWCCQMNRWRMMMAADRIDMNQKVLDTPEERVQADINLQNYAVYTSNADTLYPANGHDNITASRV